MNKNNKEKITVCSECLYIPESEAKELEKKARCWDLFKAGIENKRYSGIITNVAYMKPFIKREIEIIEQEVEADE